jgi:hypothetical protein
MQFFNLNIITFIIYMFIFYSIFLIPSLVLLFLNQYSFILFIEKYYQL